MDFRKWSILILLLSILACTSNKKPEDSSLDSEFFNYLDGLERIDSEIIILNKYDIDTILPNPLRLVVQNNSDSKMVVANGPGWDLVLLENDGKSLSTNGGTGRGPNESEGINSLEINEIDEIFALDKKSHEVEKYIIEGNELQYLETFVLPNYSPLSIRSFVNTRERFFGVFRSMERNNSQPNNRIGSPFTLFTLDKNFALMDEVIQMPGNDIIETPVPSVMQDNPVGNRTLWDITENNFSFANSESFKITSIDLESFSTKTYDFVGFPERKILEIEKEYILERFKSYLNFLPTFEREIEEINELPFYYKFDVTSTHAYFQILSYSSTNEKILQINLENNERRIIEAPEYFGLHEVKGNKLYGINNEPNAKYPIIIIMDE